MLVVRSGMGEVPAALARNEGPYASGYVLPDPSTLGTPAKKKTGKKKAAASSSSSTALATTTDAGASLLDRLKALEIPVIVWICLGLGTLAGVWYFTGKGKRGRRRRGRPFARGRRG